MRLATHLLVLVALGVPTTFARAEDGGMFNALAVSPDGKRAAAGGDGKTVLVFDLETGAVTQTLPAGAVIHGLAFAPDGKTLAAACDDRGVKVWNRTGGTFAPGWGHARVESGGAVAVAFAPDGKTLAVGLWGAGWIDFHE